jgi:ABC transport system ATP-binding/permease protein
VRAREVDPSGQKVIKVSKLGFRYGEKVLVRDFTTQIMRGDKIGVIGPNGSGKTTLLLLLLGKLLPQAGEVTLGTNLQIAYYDQLREQLDEDKSVIENVNGESNTIVINGKPRHIIGYLQDFLFTPERARTPVRILSGGERNRLFLARLFSRPSNVLVMDEPTNDLDIETLELLEELLLEYPGTILLVSHDRAFLNNVVTSTMVLEGDGVINEYAGGYDDWQVQRKPAVMPDAKAKPTQEIDGPKAPIVCRPLTSKEQRELEGFPSLIEKFEAEQKEIYTLLTDFNFYQKESSEIAKTKARSEWLSQELEKAYERWEYLEELSGE